MNCYKLLNKHKKQLISLIFISVVLLFANRLLLKDVVYESDDYKLHAVRLANYYLALKQGQLPVRWGPNLNAGYGYPSFNYMYHTPYIFGSILHMIGFDIQESLNLTVLCALFLGAIGCYFFVRSHLKSELWSILLALFYILNPYSLLNVYWRGSIGEICFYAIAPFFLLGLKKLLQNNHIHFYFLLTTVSMALLILSHLPSLLLLFLVVLTYIVAEDHRTFSWKKFIPIGYACFLGFLLTAWYVFPAYFEQWMVTYQNAGSLTQYLTQFVQLPSLLNITNNFYSNNYFLEVLQIGCGSLLAVVVAIYLIKFSKKIFYWLGLMFFSVFLLSNASKFLWDSIKPLQYIQFPWRFLWLVGIASMMIFITFVKQQKIAYQWKIVGAILLGSSLIITSSTYIASKGIIKQTDFDWYHPVSETGSSYNEHLPIWAHESYYFPEELLYINVSEKNILDPLNLTKCVHRLSELNPSILKFDGTTIIYQIKPDQDIIILHKRLFYPGWEARLDGKKIDFVDDVPEYQGVLAVSVPNKDSLIEIEFTGYTKLRKFSEFVSLVAALLLVGQLVLRKKRSKQS